jgi:hypothetical protein
MNSVNLIKHNYKLSTRTYTLTKDKHFKIPSIGLIQSFKILNFNSILEKYSNENLNEKYILKIVPCITIGNFKIIPKNLFLNNDTSNISIKDLRNYIRNIDFPETEFENQLINFEHYLFSQQLKSTEYYYTIKNNDLYDSIFTSGLNIYIELHIDSNCDDINIENIENNDLIIEETYWEKIYN